jgi:ribosomal protein S18 acetylase RimI-like enzyme
MAKDDGVDTGATAAPPLVARRLGADDVAVFRSLRLAALATDPIAFASNHAEWAALDESAWRERLRLPVFAAFRDGRPVGLIGHVPADRSKRAHRTTLVMVWVRPEARGCGVAEALIAAAIEDARRSGFRWLDLDVAVDQTAAQRLYARMGFVEIGRVPGALIHEGREVDEILMTLRLVEA